MADHHLVAAFSYLHDIGLYAELADAVGQFTTAQKYRNKLVSLKAEFNQAFYNSER